MQAEGILSRDGYVTTQDGVRLFFRTLGGGPRVVVIPNGIYLLGELERLAAEGRTVIFYDLRNRGRSDHVSDSAKLRGGILHDVEDLDAVRRHFGASHVSLIAHSYVALAAALYAMEYPAHVSRMVQIGPSPPNAATKYPAHLTCDDATLSDVFTRLAHLQRERQAYDPAEFCRKFWSVLRVIYVADPADAEKIKWDRCDLPNELAFMKYWGEHLLPSIQSLNLTDEDFAKATMPVLIIHGIKDRSAPYGGGKEWALRLPDARLVTVEHAAHAPWIEAPETVFTAIETFLDGAWPETAQEVTSLDP